MNPDGKAALDGRTAIVTGGSRSIGRGIALALARAGADVVVNYKTNRDAAEQVVKEIEASGRRALAFQADVADYDRVKEMTTAAVDAFGKVDILVCNAGILHRNVEVFEVDLDAFHQMIDTHIMGAFHCIQAVLPVMRRQPRGDIHLLSSTHTIGLPRGLLSYNVAKAGLEALAQCLAKEERSNDIRVNVIAPTTTESDMASGLLQRVGLSSFREMDQYMPFGRVVQPRDIANLCVYLASEEGSHISGQVIAVDASQGKKATIDFLPQQDQQRQRSGI